MPRTKSKSSALAILSDQAKLLAENIDKFKDEFATIIEDAEKYKKVKSMVEGISQTISTLPEQDNQIKEDISGQQLPPNPKKRNARNNDQKTTPKTPEGPGPSESQRQKPNNLPHE